MAQWLSEEDEDGFARAAEFALEAGAASQKITAWAKREAAAGRAHQWPYLTRHMAAHLDPADRAAVFGELLFDLPWLDARRRWGDLNALLADFQWGEGFGWGPWSGLCAKGPMWWRTTPTSSRCSCWPAGRQPAPPQPGRSG